MASAGSQLLEEFSPRLMLDAWIGSLFYTAGQAEALAAFKRDTGISWSPPRNGLERMIDEATGRDAEIVRAFCKWHNEAVWGLNKDGKPFDMGDDQEEAKER